MCVCVCVFIYSHRWVICQKASGAVVSHASLKTFSFITISKNEKQQTVEELKNAALSKGTI